MQKIWMMLIVALLCVPFTAMGQPKPQQPPKAAAAKAEGGQAAKSGQAGEG